MMACGDLNCGDSNPRQTASGVPKIDDRGKRDILNNRKIQLDLAREL